MKCIPFSNAFTIIMEIYYMCSTFVTSSTPSAQTNREKRERQWDLCTDFIYIILKSSKLCMIFSLCHFFCHSLNKSHVPTISCYKMCSSFSFDTLWMVFAIRFLMIENTVPFPWIYYRALFSQSSSISRAFPHRLNLCSNKMLWMVGSLFQLFPLFRQLFWANSMV